MFISEGASVFGVFWKIIRTPSTSNSSMSFSTIRVGAISPMVPAEIALAQALADVAVGADGQQQAVLVEQPPVHGVAGVDVLGDRVLHEVARGDDLDLAGAHVRLVDDAAHAAPVVAVGVRVDHRRDRQALADVLLEQLPAPPRTSRR